MKAPSFTLLVAIVLAGCSQNNPIGRIVKEGSADATFGMGTYSPIVLPAATSPTRLAAEALGQSQTNFTVLETRHVQISYGDQQAVDPESTSYTAVLVNSSSGRKVVLLQFRQDRGHKLGYWWSRIYDL
jgi:hypothetical protein